MEELVPLITEVINSGAIFKLYPHGQSMLPTIEEGVDECNPLEESCDTVDDSQEESVE